MLLHLHSSRFTNCTHAPYLWCVRSRCLPQRIRRKNCGSTLWLLLALMRLHQDREADLGSRLRSSHENARCAVIKLRPGRDVSDLYLRITKGTMAIALHNTLGAAYLGACMCIHVIQICSSCSWRDVNLLGNIFAAWYVYRSP